MKAEHDRSCTKPYLGLAKHRSNDGHKLRATYVEVTRHNYPSMQPVIKYEHSVHWVFRKQLNFSSWIIAFEVLYITV